MNESRAICTIIAKNYIAAARTLCRSYLALHPQDRCFVLIVDEFGGYINPLEECFEVVSLEDLRIPDAPSFCFKYDVTELCTAVKPTLLKYLLREKGVDKLLYIDPDILITGPLEGLYERMEAHDIVLTPHLDTDYPEDGLRPNDANIMACGMFNLGFIGVSGRESVMPFLDWWEKKLYDKCIADPYNVYFVDQKFVDFVPSLFDSYFIEKDTGYNVAYWNLHSRRISRDGAMWKCNGGPLHFFHFSGYSPDRPDIISKYMTRYRSSDRADLQPLFALYRKLLLENGHEQAKGWRYTFNFFKTGEFIPPEVRVSYRNSAARWQIYGNPFESDALKRQAWLIRMRDRSPNRYAVALRAYRSLRLVRRVVGRLTHS